MPPRTRNNQSTPQDSLADPNPDELPPGEADLAAIELARLEREGRSATPSAPPLAEDDIDLGEPGEDWDGETYIVLTDALNIKVGPRTNQTVRLRSPQTVIFSEETRKYVDVDHLVTIKAIAPNDGRAYPRTTARAMAAAAGAADDPVPVPRSMLVREAAGVGPVDTAAV